MEFWYVGEDEDNIYFCCSRNGREKYVQLPKSDLPFLDE